MKSTTASLIHDYVERNVDYTNLQQASRERYCWVAFASALLATGLFGCSSNTTTTSSIGTIATVAGTGTLGYSGNGRLATSAQLDQPTCAVVDNAGNLYIGDVATNTVRKVAAGTGIISLYAGNGGAPGYSGDGGVATLASMNGPSGCALDSAGNLYVAEAGNNVVRKITASTGIITTVAGNGFGDGCEIGMFSGDGDLATNANLSCPYGVALDAAGDIFISDQGNQRVREVDGSTGIITTIAGNGTYGYSGNGSAATSAMIGNPEQLSLDGSGNLYIAEQGASVIAKVNLSTGIISTVAGNGTIGEGSTVLGDGGLATQAQLAEPQGVVVDTAGDIFISDTNNQRVRKVTASTRTITTVVGTTTGYSGDGGPTSRARLHNPEALFFDASGNLYIADSYNGVVRKVTP
jgi:sugar lactone lactonase YvrE